MDAQSFNQRPAGRPRKKFDAEDHEVLINAATDGHGLRVMTRLINEARQERRGDAAETVSHWRVQRELMDLGYESTPNGYAIPDAPSYATTEVEAEVQSTPDYQSLPEVLTPEKVIGAAPAPKGIPWPAILLVGLAAAITMAAIAWFENRQQAPEPERRDPWFQPAPGWW